MTTLKKPRIKVYVTRSFKFRASVQVPGQKRQEVTLGGKTWKEGKLGEYHPEIIKKASDLLATLRNEMKDVRAEKYEKFGV